MPTRQVSSAWILCAVIVGAGLAGFVPVESPILDALVWVALGVMVFCVVQALPLLSLGKAIAKPRVLVALFSVNLLVVPAVSFVLSRVLWQHPDIQVGLLLVLLAPRCRTLFDHRETSRRRRGKRSRSKTSSAGGATHRGAPLCDWAQWWRPGV